MRHLWKRGAQGYHILKVEDTRRKLEEEDQVIYDCYSIPCNQLIVLLPFLCPPVNTHPQDALTQQLHLLLPSLFVFALNTSFHLFRFLPCSLLHSRLVSLHMMVQVLKKSNRDSFYDPRMLMETKGSLKKQCPCLIHRH